MKILLDEGLPRRAAALLRDEGVDTVHLTEVAASSTADRLILERAREEGRVVTLDADFHALLAMSGQRLLQSYGFEGRGFPPRMCAISSFIF